MDRTARIKFCEVCNNKGFSPQSGIICKLTNAPAAFETTCSDFNEDKIESGKLAEYRASREIEEGKAQPFDFEKKIANGDMWKAMIAIFGSIVWFVVGYVFLDRIFYYPPILFIVGVVALIRGILKQKEEGKKRRMDVLDEEL
ncbi:MAG: hypothetical protein ACJA0U_002232 [Salibacteraceae bacterium]|jgi:hypothetical protein